VNRTRIAHWELGALLVLGLLGAWLARPGVVVALLAVIAAAALAVVAAWTRRPGSIFTAVLAAAAAITALLTARQVKRIEQHWPDVREGLIQQASARLAATLEGAVSTARDLARAGVELGDVTQAQAFERLRRVTSASGPERGVVVRDSAGRPWAWAGRQRLGPVATTDELYARITPFYAVLEARRQVSGLASVGHVLLAADSAVPDAGETVAARFARTNSVRLEFVASRSAPRANDVFDYCIPACGDPKGADTLFSVRTVAPTPADAESAALARGGRLAGWLVVLLLITLAATGAAWARFAAGPALLLLGILTPLPDRLGLHQAFASTTYSLPDLGLVTASAGALALAAALVILIVAAAGRFSVQARIRPLVLGGAALVVLTLPAGLEWLVSGMHVPAEGVGVALWLTWAVALTLAVAALLLVAAALFEASGRAAPVWTGSGAGWLAVAWGGVLAVWGLEMWVPGGWPAWYVWAWLPAYAVVAQPRRMRRRLVLIALVAGAAAVVQNWDGIQRGRLRLAERDVARLGPGGDDPVVVSLLDQFGAELAQGEAPRSDAELYARWDRSPLAADHYPVTLMTWAPDGAIAGRLDLAELDLPAALLQRLAVSAKASGVPFVEALPRVPGLHYVLAVPYPDGEVVTVGVGPRSRLIRPARAAGLLRGAGTRAPPFEVSLSVPHGGDVSETLKWRREGWSVLGEARLELPGGTRHVHVQVAVGGGARLLTRGVLIVLLGALALVALWAGGAALSGRLTPASWAGARRMRLSYRARLTFVLAVFFVVPTIVFAAWTAGRSQAEARAARDLAIQQTLRDAARTARELVTGTPDRAERGLDDLADRFDADLELYQGGVLTQTSADALAQLGLIDYYLPPDAYAALALEDRLELSADAERAGRAVRVGYQTLAVFSDGPAVLAAARPVADPTRAPAQEDLAYGLLLATLAGLAAAWVLAAMAARALATPVHILREAAVRVGRGEPVGDLTADVPAEFAPVAEAVDRMAQAVRVLAWGELARQIAHEIKNPLTPIRLGVQHLQRAYRDHRPDFEAQLDRAVKQILAEIERLDAIARAFARFGAPAAEAGPLEAVDVAAVAAETAQLYALGGKTTVLVSGGGQPARARKDELREVLINLIENARDAGATEVRIAIQPGTIVATDNGRGIPPADLPRIFEPRFSTTSSGTGLGLAICRRLVESWGATITVESAVGQGTTVTLQLADGGS
jgi:signal transduction histidine kinase